MRIESKESPKKEVKIPPKVRYYQPKVSEEFFDTVNKLLRNLPDIVKVKDNWYSVYEDNKNNKAKFKGMYDEQLSRKKGALYIPRENGKPQAFIALDSIPAMIPKNIDEQDEAKTSMAADAIANSKLIKRIRSKLAPKRVG